MDEIAITPHDTIDVIPGVRGQRAFPTQRLRYPDPFIMLDHIGPQRMEPNWRIGGGTHPHRGFETVTIWLSGRMDHVDSLGNRIALEAGDVQVMNAGSGILHGGDMTADPKTGVFHEIQLWVNVPAAQRMASPTVHGVKAAQIPNVVADGVRTRVLTGTLLGEQSPASTVAGATIAHVTAEPGSVWTRPEDGQAQPSYLYVLTGDVRIGDVGVAACNTASLPADTPLSVEAGERGAEWLFLSGKPLGERVTMGGPFVMSTPSEIEQAFADFEAGRFGVVNSSPPRTPCIS